MISTKSINKVRQEIEKAKKRNKRIGFVPTMGALHRGHLSLIDRAKKESDYLAVSIFINPLQFDSSKDLTRYPRNLRKDKELLKKRGVDLLFFPQADRLYSPGFSVFVEETKLSKILCGKSRPGHFRGVTTVVAKLFNIVNPELAYFGQKDYQQALIIRKMAKNLNFAIKIKIAPIVREKDGLALSSRNSYLNSKQRREANAIYQALSLGAGMIKKGERNPDKITKLIKKEVKNNSSALIDYVEVRGADKLEKIEKIEGKIFLGIAAYLGEARLIDNIILKSN